MLAYLKRLLRLGNEPLSPWAKDLPFPYKTRVTVTAMDGWKYPGTFFDVQPYGHLIKYGVVLDSHPSQVCYFYSYQVTEGYTEATSFINGSAI